MTPRRRPTRACVECDYTPSRYRVNARTYLCAGCYTRWFVEGVPMEEIQRKRETVDDKALFMTVWRPSTRSAENSCGIRQG